MSNPNYGNQLILPIDGSAANPPLQVGGGYSGNTGTGIYGGIQSLSISVNASQMVMIDEDGLHMISGSILRPSDVYSNS